MYKSVAKDDATFRQYLDEWVFGLKNQEEYLNKIGGAGLVNIKANTIIGYAPGLDRR